MTWSPLITHPQRYSNARAEREVAALLTIIVTINAWNRIVATTRYYEPGSYQPQNPV